MAAVREFLRQNGKTTMGQIAERTGARYANVHRAVVCLERVGEITPVPRESRSKIKAGSPTEEELIGQLRDGIEPIRRISQKSGLSDCLIKRICKRYGLRSELAKKYIASGLGLNPDLLPNPPVQITVSDKQRIMRENAQVIGEMLSEFPERSREMLAERARKKVWGGLAKYYEGLMSTRHFVMLVTTRAVYGYLLEEMKELGIKRILSLHRPKDQKARERALSEAETLKLEGAVRENLREIKNIAWGWRTAVASGSRS